MATFSNFSNHKKMQKYTCDLCTFACSNKNNYTKHLDTEKHKKAFLATLATNSSSEKCQMRGKNAKLYRCDFCQRAYKDKTGLWRHNKKCGVVAQSDQEDSTPYSPVTPELIMSVMKQNEDLRQLVFEQNKTIVEISRNANQNTIQNQTNNMTNCHNKTFNLQFFLNETCKDAMNITDFVNSLKLNLQDLENVGELGYAEGISRVFVKGLNELEVTKRPIHCSDLKREVLHIKDKDKWERDNPAQDKLRKAIKDVSNKNIMLLDDWQKVNPGCTEYDHRKNNIYLRMVVEAMGPADETTENKDFGKIIRTIAKSTIIDKTAIA